MLSRRGLLRSILALPFLRFIKPAPQPQLTLLDYARAQNTDLLPVVEALGKKNALLQDVAYHDGRQFFVNKNMQTSIWLTGWSERSIFAKGDQPSRHDRFHLPRGERT